MMIRKPNFFVIGCLLALPLVHPLSAQERRETKTAKHSLWKLEGERSTVYLLGSVHLLKKEDYPLPSPIEAAFTNAQIVVFETDQEKMQAQETQMKLMSKAQLPAGQTLRQQLSPETYAAFSRHLEKAGLPAAALDTFKPLLAATVLEMAELQKLGFDPKYGLDEYFSRRARKEGKEIVALETVDFQIELFTGLDQQESESIMKAELKEIENTEKEFAEMLKAWSTGDAQTLEKLLQQAFQEFPAIYKRLLTDRNRNWLPKIQELAHGGRNALIIVGAGHLVGDQGVVQLLKKKGMKVTQL